MINEEPQPFASEASGDSKVQSGPSRMQIHQYEQYPDEIILEANDTLIYYSQRRKLMKSIRNRTKKAIDAAVKRKLSFDKSEDEPGEGSNMDVDINEAAETPSTSDKVAGNSAPEQ